jgi:Transcriptional regulators
MKMSIKDVAKLSGVSISTVSRVLNNNGRMSEETRRRVMQVIESSGYRPNMAAKSLRDKISKTIGIIVPNINNELFSEIVLEIEKFFFEKGYSTFICNTNQDPHKEITYFETLGAKQVDGIICISGLEAIPTNVTRSNIPVVCIDRKPNLDSDAYYVESDHYIGGFLATEELIRSGAGRILILSKANSISVNKQRLQGYQDALAKYNIPIDEELIVKLPGTRSNFEEARDNVNYLIAKGVRFDGVFGTNDWRAYGALSALLQNGIAVPEQVKIVGFDAISVSEYCTPQITTIYQDKQALALNAAELLYGLINKTSLTAKKHIVIPVSLIKRATT